MGASGLMVRRIDAASQRGARQNISLETILPHAQFAPWGRRMALALRYVHLVRIAAMAR
jgi:hypothetical protein